VGVKWKTIRTNDRFRKEPAPITPPEPVSAMHIEAAANKVFAIRNTLSKWYSTSSKSFPDGTKMRLVPPFQSITVFSHKAKYSALVARQASISSCIGSASCYEFAANLILDRPAPDTQQTLRSYLLSIPSKLFPTTPMFHTVDKAFRSSTGLTFSVPPRELPAMVPDSCMNPSADLGAEEKNTSQEMDGAFGDCIGKKKVNVLRVGFLNVGGLPLQQNVFKEEAI
jgi:hypothetical protein